MRVTTKTPRGRQEGERTLPASLPMIHLVAVKRMKSLKQLLKDTISDSPGTFLACHLVSFRPRLILSRLKLRGYHQAPFELFMSSHTGVVRVLVSADVFILQLLRELLTKGGSLERQVPLTSLCPFLHNAGRPFLPYL